MNFDPKVDTIVDEKVKEIFSSSVKDYFYSCYNFIEPIAKALQFVSLEAYDQTIGQMRDWCVDTLYYIFAKSFVSPLDEVVFDCDEIRDYFYNIMCDGEDATHICFEDMFKNTFYDFNVDEFYNEAIDILVNQEDEDMNIILANQE